MKNVVSASVTLYVQYSCTGRYTKLVLERTRSYVLHFTSVYDAWTHRSICGNANDLYMRCHQNKKKAVPI